ncbi:biliverdin-producing heme oxygenase [Limnoglobus roseus]|uniref:Heme oxygenase n=1 Tax=Limnoglobus roseus TaxID=2598579 RepID=A0A5C1AEP8_9BACT|nr:biliverdin-producing heme oxygenase [Limnoglobus roseus]QEL15574.1 heme oxygenase [Limnoglobus roseus]
MILTRLRAETRTRHDAVEARLGFLDRPITSDSYRELLRQFWGFYEPVEARIATATDWPALEFDFNGRRKTPLLERDLATAGVGREALDKCHCPALPPLTDVPQALGCLYVLEGATLGGQVITRHLRGQPGGPYPTAFFASYGENVGPMWKAFGAFLTEYTAGHGGDDRIVASACATFDTLGAWLAAGEGRP